MSDSKKLRQAFRNELDEARESLNTVRSTCETIALLRWDYLTDDKVRSYRTTFYGVLDAVAEMQRDVDFIEGEINKAGVEDE